MAYDFTLTEQPVHRRIEIPHSAFAIPQSLLPSSSPSPLPLAKLTCYAM